MLPRAGTERSQREASRGSIGGRTHEIQRLVGRSLRGVIDMQRLGELVPLRRRTPLRRQSSRIVDDDVQRRLGRQECFGERRYGVEIGNVAAPDGDFGAGDLSAQFVRDPLTLVGVAHHEVNAGAQSRESFGGGRAETGRGPGDDRLTPFQAVGRRVVGPGWEPLADLPADPGEAGGHGAVEGGVDEGGKIHTVSLVPSRATDRPSEGPSLCISRRYVRACARSEFCSCSRASP